MSSFFKFLDVAVRFVTSHVMIFYLFRRMVELKYYDFWKNTRVVIMIITFICLFSGKRVLCCITFGRLLTALMFPCLTGHTGPQAV